MAVIPSGVFKDVEWHLHNEQTLVRQALNARQETVSDLLHGCGFANDGMPKGKGGHSEATANKALALVKAGAEVEAARAWVQAIRQTYAYFEGSTVAQMATGYYGRQVKITALADTMGTNEKTLDRYRDKFVSTCALFAAAGGLVSTDCMTPKNG